MFTKAKKVWCEQPDIVGLKKNKIQDVSGMAEMVCRKLFKEIAAKML
jgi:hypothetical protein